MDSKGLEHRRRHHIQHIAHIFEQNCQQKIEKQMYLENSSCSVARDTVELQSLFIKVPAHYPTCSNPLSLQFPSLSLPIPSHFSSFLPFTLQLIPPFSSSSHFLFYFKPLTLSFPFFCLSPNPYFPVPFPFSHLPTVTVIRASPRFGHPPFQNSSDMGIPCNPNPNPHRKGNMRRGCPYH